MSTPTVTHTDTAGRLRVAIARLARQLRQQTVGELTLTQLSALSTVEALAPVRLADLADREGVSAATATRVVVALEALGMVCRETDPADRRSSLVSLTPTGRKTIDRGRTVRTARLSHRLAKLPPEDLRRLVDVLPLLETLAADER